MKKILYVEDEQDEVLMVKTRVEDHGYAFIAADFFCFADFDVIF